MANEADSELAKKLFSDSLAALDSLAGRDDKFDAVYLNTPWKQLPTAEALKTLPLARLTKADGSALFMWVDSHGAGAAADALAAWGFNFHSVVRILDIAEYGSRAPRLSKDKPKPDAKPEEPKAEEPRPDGARPEEPQPEGAKPEEAQPEAEKADKPRRRAKVAQIYPPQYWWASSEREVARSTTEQLWFAVRGDPEAVLERLQDPAFKTLPFQLAAAPDLGRKNRSQKKAAQVLSATWLADRPAFVRDEVGSFLRSGARVLEMFGSRPERDFDSWGPNVPGGYLGAVSGASGDGLVALLAGAVEDLRKVRLQASLVAVNRTLAALASGDRDAARAAFGGIGDLWAKVDAALAAGPSGFAVPYDTAKDEDGLPPRWLLQALALVLEEAVRCYDAQAAAKKRRKRGKAKGAKAPSDPNRPRYGISAPSKVSDDICQFMGLPPGSSVPRTHVVKAINEYVKANNLQDPEHKMHIRLDDKLKALLKPPPDFGEVKFFTLHKLLKDHFPESADKKRAKAGEAEGKPAKRVKTG